MNPLSDSQPDNAWTPASLRQVVTSGAIDQVIVLACDEPFAHDTADDGRVLLRHSHSAVVSAVEPLLRATSGTWIAHGAAAGDRLPARTNDGLDVPPQAPAYRLRRIWFNDGENERYYNGFVHGGLWPLCHRAHVPPVFRSEDFNTYWEINSRFVDALQQEIRGHAPLVLVQDHPLALAPMMIRAAVPQATIVACWHIPWPDWQRFETCPWHRQLLEGLLGADLLAFQTVTDARSFLEATARLLKGGVQRSDESVTRDGHTTQVGTYPTAIAWPSSSIAAAPPVSACRASIDDTLRLPPEQRLSIGVSRLDYTKGIEEAFCAIGHLLEEHPEYRGRLTHVQLAAPSRTGVAAYREYRRRVQDAADRVNRRFARGDYRPIVLLAERWDPAAVMRLMRAANVCYVSSLHDGMSLVAKEFVAARDDEHGVLVLSAFAGAAWQLNDALVVNPYDRDEVARTIVRALEMPPDQQAARLRQLRRVAAETSATAWAGRLLTDASRVRTPVRQP